MVRLCLPIVTTALLTLAGCATLNGPAFVPYEVYVEALVTEEPEALAPFVRDAVAGTVIVGDAPAPPDAQYVARLQSHPAGTQLRIERRLTQAGFYDGTQLLFLLRKALRAWKGDANLAATIDGARLTSQAGNPSCVSDASGGGLELMNDMSFHEELRQGDTAPVLIGGLEGLQRQISYPEPARRSGTEGVVVAQFEVNEEGSVTCADVSVGLPFGINEEVLSIVRTLRFEPARVNDEPTKVRFWLPVKFRLR